MKKLKRKKFIIYDVIFKSNCTFLIAWTFEEMNYFLEKNGFEKIRQQRRGDAMCVHMEKDGADYFLFWIEKEPTMGLIAHEMTHLIFGILKSKGIEHNEHTDETFAYLTDFYTRELYKRL